MITYRLISENFSILDKYKSRDLVELVCNYCSCTYKLCKHHIQAKISKKVLNNFCSPKCHSEYKTTNGTQLVNCLHCDTIIKKKKSQIKKSPNHFCSQSCAGAYNIKNKTHGTRRSKLEIWLEERLIQLYPTMEFHFNRKDTISSELDIYVPSMKLAFELNGIFHYEPIYGNSKLNQIQQNDINKFQRCQELGISLCIIDTSSQKRFTEKSSQKFLDIIVKIITDFL